MARDFEITVTPSLKKLNLKLVRFNDRSLDAIRFRLIQGGQNIRNTIIDSMQKTPKTGIKYKRGKGSAGRWHIASSPGNAPAVDTGELWRSLTLREGMDEIEVGVGAPHGIHLEKGTKKMKARPFLEPAANAEIPKIERRIINDLTSFKL